MNIYISNLSSAIKDSDLEQLFAGYGEVTSARVMNDVFTGESRGFGYVEMADDEAAQKAIEKLNNTELQNLTISVKEEEPKTVHKGSYKVGNPSVNGFKFRRN
jgi:RNA recognition motif-containing protein